MQKLSGYLALSLVGILHPLLLGLLLEEAGVELSNPTHKGNPPSDGCQAHNPGHAPDGQGDRKQAFRAVSGQKTGDGSGGTNSNYWNQGSRLTRRSDPWIGPSNGMSRFQGAQVLGMIQFQVILSGTEKLGRHQ
jgi:hypothetical protein